MTFKRLGRLSGLAMSIPLSYYVFNQMEQQSTNPPVEFKTTGNRSRIGFCSDDTKFSLTNSQSLKKITQHDFLTEGSWNLLYFGFTHCAEVCPNTLKYIDEVILKLRDLTKDDQECNVRCSFVSIDPNRDSPEKMEKFFDRFVAKRTRDSYTGYLGSYADIESVAKVWKIYFAAPDEQDAEENPEYQMDHSCFIFLVSPEGKFMDFFTKDMTVEMAVDKILLHIDGMYET